MALTPVEIRHLTFSRRPLGYRRPAVDATLDQIADSFEDVWRGRADLADRVEHLEAEIVRYRELEALLRTTLISAERASQELKEQARREAELLLNEARAEARAVTRRARGEHERLLAEIRKLKALLRSALAVVEGDEPKGSGAEAGEPKGDPWEQTEDTGEWGAAA